MPTMLHTAEAFVEQFRAQPVCVQEATRLLINAASTPVSPEEKVFVDEYTAHFDKRKAASVAGYSPQSGGALANRPRLEPLIAEKLEERAARTDLTADYVREYMFDVLELCPTDYFAIAEDGQWMIDPESFKLLPDKIRRLVQGVELRFVKGKPVYKVDFVSKQAVLSLAARFTLVQKSSVALSTLPWDQLVEPLQDEAVDAISARLAAERMQPRSVQTGEAPVAGCDVLRQAEADC